MNPPGEPHGIGPLFSWLRRLRSFVIGLQIRPGVGYLVHQGTDGVRLEINRGGGGVAAPRRLRLDSCEADYLVCHTWDGTTEGTADVIVAKPLKLRQEQTLVTLDGAAVTYSWSTVAGNIDFKRTAISSGVTEEHYVAPRWLVDDEIYAIGVDTDIPYLSVAGTVTETLTASMIDLNLDARAWVAEC